MVADDTPADAVDHRAVATGQSCERSVVLVIDEGSQELGIRPARRLLPQRRLAKMPHHRVHLSSRHAALHGRSPPTSTLNCPVRAKFIHFFVPLSQTAGFLRLDL